MARAERSPPRLDRSGARMPARRARGTRRVRGTPRVEIVAPERPVGIVILPAIIPLSASTDGLRLVAAGLQDRGFATFLVELLSPAETEHGYHNFDFGMLGDRITKITEKLSRRAPFEDLPIGYFGSSIDGAAMAIAAAQPNCPASALVMYNTRPELAAAELPRLHAPTLFIVEDDQPALDLNRSALAQLGCPCDLAVLRCIGKGLACPETASQVVELAGDWFATHLDGKKDD